MKKPLILRVICLAIAGVMLLGVVFTVIFSVAADDSVEEIPEETPLPGYTLEIDGSNATITSYYPETQEEDEIVIPGVIDGFTVVSIGNGAFAGNGFVKKITIPNNVTSIGENAFLDCILLETIIIPNSVTQIGNGAFMNCTRLDDVKLPGNLEHISDNLFNGCSYLYDIQLPTGLKTIGESAFSNCSSLSKINLPANLTIIGNSAFRNSTLFAVTLPSRVTRIGENAFSGCGRLETINIPVSVTQIGTNAFNGCSRLTIFADNNSTAHKYAVDNRLRFRRRGYNIVRFIADNWVMETKEVKTGSKVTKPTSSKMKFKNHTFINWYNSPYATVRFNLNNNITRDVDVFALYERNPLPLSSVKKSKVTKGKVKINWKTTRGHKYEVQRSTKKSSGFKRISTTSKSSVTASKLKKKKTYYFRVRQYKTVRNVKVYSNYSKVLKVKA